MLGSHEKDDFSLSSILREAKHIPESQSVTSLLEDFKKDKAHLAIVLDEYGVISGLITIEDILEEIVGEIEDEFYEEKNNEIIKINDKEFIVSSTIEKEKFEVLFYPDIGMSVEFYFLSLIRLAKYQIMSWGHPETTGSKSIDFFLCSKNLISENSEKFYSEKFLIIDKLPMIYNKPIIENRLDDKDMSKKNIYSLKK